MVLVFDMIKLPFSKNQNSMSTKEVRVFKNLGLKLTKLVIAVELKKYSVLCIK